METKEDREFIDDADNHSQGDEQLEAEAYHCLGKCINILGQDEDGEDIVCGDACGPNEQMCFYCTRSAHTMTGM